MAVGFHRAGIAVAVVLAAAVPRVALAASAPVAPGAAATGQFASRAVAGPLHYSIFLPSGHAEGNKRHPVIYFLPACLPRRRRTALVVPTSQ
jgi:hypothetical protein